MVEDVSLYQTQHIRLGADLIRWTYPATVIDVDRDLDRGKERWSILLSTDLEEQIEIGKLLKEGGEAIQRVLSSVRTSSVPLYVGYDFRFGCVTITQRVRP